MMMIEQVWMMAGDAIGQVMALGVHTEGGFEWPKPNFDFGAEGNSLLTRILGLLFGAGIIISFVYFFKNVVKLARSSSSNPHQHAEAKKSFKNSAIGLVAVLAFGTIVTVLMFLLGPK